jgi:hypothetical protein
MPEDFVTYSGDNDEPETIDLSNITPPRTKELSRADLDFLAQKLGYPDMKALQDEREAKARAEAEAVEKARIDAILAEQERAKIVEDRMINVALASGRLVMELADEVQDVKDFHDIMCPICKKPIAWMRETLRMAVMRSSYSGEGLKPEYIRAGPEGRTYRYDTIQTGNRGDGLRVYAPSHIMSGFINCPDCLGGMPMRLECGCTVEGFPIKGPVTPAPSYSKEEALAVTRARKSRR